MYTLFLLWIILVDPALIIVDHGYVIFMEVLVKVEPEALTPRFSSGGYEMG